MTDALRKSLRITRQHAENIAAACAAVEQALVKAETLGIAVNDRQIAQSMNRISSRSAQLITHMREAGHAAP
jgi:hypothetical protein